MIYQLAKTSPLLTGQVKMNMIMNGNKVVDLQYTPISNYIPFNYSNPVDVLNYTHGENIKLLYKKISNSFFKETTNPVLSVKQLHRYDTLIDDTHEGTYEMGMKRLEFQRYRKQFEFFCPIWCDNTTEFKNLRFIINLTSPKNFNSETNEHRIMYSKEIQFSDKIKKYLDNIYPSMGIEEDNKELLYLNFKEMTSHIKGLSVKTGNVQTVDTSYVVNNLLYQERPVLETDNMLVNLFNSHEIVATQLFNFNFVFDITDFIPLNMINNFIFERVNVFIDVYKENEKVLEKDFYSNYDFIPRYDIYTGEYNKNHNVFDYLQDNKSIEIINKNKLTQGTFHWCLYGNDKNVFNLYNGFSPVYNDKANSTSISNDTTDMFTDTYDVNKNPFGVFKYKVIDVSSSFITDFINKIDKDENYYTFDIEDISKKEYSYFGNILISNKKVKTLLDGIKKQFEDYNQSDNSGEVEYSAFSDNYIIVPEVRDNKDVPVVWDDEKNGLMRITYKDSGNMYRENKILYNNIQKIKCAVFKVPDRFDYTTIRSLLPSDYLLTSLEYEENGEFYNDLENFVSVKYYNGIFTLMFFIKFTPKIISKSIKDTIFFKCLYNYDFSNYIYNKKTKDSNYHNYPGKYREEIKYIHQKLTTITSSHSDEDDIIKDGIIFVDKKRKTSSSSSSVGVPTTSSSSSSIGVPKTSSSSSSIGVPKVPDFIITQKRICYNAINFIASILKCAKFPNMIVFNKSFSNIKANSPSIDSNEVYLTKTDKVSMIYRYDSNLYPLFIDLENEDVLKNNVYWCKQYDKTIFNTLKNSEEDLDNIETYAKFALDKFTPLYPSIGYFVLNSKELDYNTYYLPHYLQNTDDDRKEIYRKEISWYKKNSFIYLPYEFESTLDKPTGEQITVDDLINEVYKSLKNISEYDEKELTELIYYYILNLYKYTYTYDYKNENDISEQIYKIKFTLK